jgi:hypothetical protein
LYRYLAATCAVCAAFDAMRAEVQLRTSVRVYREMPGLRKALYDAAGTQELLDELVVRVFGGAVHVDSPWPVAWFQRKAPGFNP